MGAGSLRRAAALWLVLFGVFAATVGLHASPGEDLSAPEARYLLTAESLASDGDFDVSDQYRERAWRDVYGGDLVPLGRPHNGRLLEPGGIGFPLVVAPAYALGGAIAVELLLAAIAALGFVLAAALARRLVPEPWATGAALTVGLSPPALVAATTIAPDALAGTALAGAALLALRARESPRLRHTFAAGLLLALLPWLAVRFLAPVAVLTVVLYRRARGRNRTVAGLLGVEAVLFSVVLFAAINDPLYGGLIPDAVLPDGVSASGAAGLLDHLARAPRLLTLWVDPRVGLLRWAPFLALSLVGLWLLARSRRRRLAVALSEHVDVEVTAGFLALVCAASMGVAVFLAPTIGGPWFAGQRLVAILPLAAALAAWGLRRLPRTGRVLAAVTVVLSLWLVVAVRVDDRAGVAPPRGAAPIGVR